MKYDDASWHYGGNFPSELPPAAGATHIAMFVAWCLLNGFAGEIHTDDFPDELEKLKNKKVTPGSWFINACDEQFTDEDLNDEGNAFTNFYYAADDAPYLNEYSEIVADEFESIYEVPDTWETYKLLEPAISASYANWKALNG